MDLQELLTLLELEQPGDFEYFEDMAGIMESEEEIPISVLAELFAETEPETVSELLANYFEDILEAMPDQETDMYLLLENIRRSLQGLVMAGEGAESETFAEELHRFRTWYTRESQVDCEGIESGDHKSVTLQEALVLARLEKLDGEEQRYDFSGCLDYAIDDYIMELSAMAFADEEEELDPDDYDPDEDREDDDLW